MSVTLTENAAKHVHKMLAQRGRGQGLRLTTKKSGCSGFAYVVDYADEIGEADQVFEFYGVKLVVAPESLSLIDGMEVDYVKAKVLNEGFEFRNPNAKSRCGCGESFDV